LKIHSGIAITIYYGTVAVEQLYLRVQTV